MNIRFIDFGLFDNFLNVRVKIIFLKLPFFNILFYYKTQILSTI